ncbi:predicted protein [Naegleria gruberi]|uniref:phenylalanine--tRNA ligase n=1 Tax=Naegleria gruberi TaxID=5762 RepID=D2W197_NAEGR|nr:uncharacterized protein NAEGRDRAFT_82010 [Naegleria gruberi]EFC37190.1 predicted protein [Naegleria gruberi]|eukprot:XP_002669934.1 predicted protein [Naegleria gruberi strain NEG-M]
MKIKKISPIADADFEQLCFDFGIELDDVTSERLMKEKELGSAKDTSKLSDEVIYKIEIPANRYDLLCEEGLSRALNIFLGRQDAPTYKIDNSKTKQLLKINVKKETGSIRKFVVGAVLRNITFTEDAYNSFIDLQEKLHQNICRKRTLVAIGTHDLDVIEGPFTYEALPPKEIKFIPLDRTELMDADELFAFIEKKGSEMKHLSPYTKIIKDSPVYPVILDAKRRVLSLPPIINGDHSKIKMSTKNVFIECTATDLTKAKVVLNTVVTMFSEHCSVPFTVEQVEIVYEDKTQSKDEPTPILDNVEFTTNSDYINSRIGLNLSAQQIAEILTKMQLNATVTQNNELRVLAPPTRSDVLHACDIMEDVAIAHGYNNIPITFPKSSTVGKENELNQLSEMVRLELAMSGYTEVLSLILCNDEENFKYMNRVNDGKTAIAVAEPCPFEFKTARISLIPGLLKTLQSNKSLPLPIKLFECGDVILVDDSKDVGAKNNRRLAALFSSATSGLELIHGLVDRVMEVLAVPFEVEHSQSVDKHCFSIFPSNDISFLPGRQADIFYKGKKIGIFGIIHPEVASNFGLKTPVSVFEIELEPFQ